MPKLDKEQPSQDEVLKAADEAVTEDVRSMLDDLIDEEEDKDEDKDEKKDEKDSEDKESEDEKDDEKKDEEDKDEDKEEDVDKDVDKDKDEEKEDEKKEEDEEPKVDVKVAATIARLEGRIDELSKAAQAKDKEEDVEEKPAIDAIEFISKDRDLAENPLTVEELNELYNQARMSAYEEAIKATPGLVGKLVDSKVTLDDAVKAFYEENEDLAPIKDYVGGVANMVVSENPDWEITKVLEETEKRVREYLSLEKKAKDTHKKAKGKKDEDEEEGDEEEEDSKKKKSPLASKRGGKSGRKGDDTRSEEQRGIDDIVSVGA